MAEYKINYTQSNFTGGIIAAELYGRNDFNKVKAGLKKCTNWTIREAGGLEFRRGTKYVSTVPSGAGNNFHISSLGNTLILFGTDKAYYLDANNAFQDVVGAYPTGNVPNMSNIMFQELQQKLYYYDGTVKLSEIYLDENNLSVPTARLSTYEAPLSDASVSLTVAGTQPSPYVPVTYSYAISIASDQDHESIATIAASDVTANSELGAQYITVSCTISASDITAALAKNPLAKLFIYKRYQGKYYYLTAIQLVSGTTTYSYEDKGEFQPDVSHTIKSQPPYLNGDGTVSGVISLADYNQRIFMTFANMPYTIVYTGIGNYDSLAYSELREDDEAGYKQLPITHFDDWCKVVSGLDLILSTSYSISSIQGSADLTLKTELFDGFSKTVQPVCTRRSLIFTNTNNRNIYDLSYNEYGQYDAPDLTLLVKYIFEQKTIKRLCFKDYPVKTIYVLCDDGDLYCLTYIKDQNIYAWYKLEHTGKIVDMCVINRDTEDIIYIVVDYDSGGSHNYVVERAYSRTDAVYTDCTVRLPKANLDADTCVLTGIPTVLAGQKVRVFDLANNFFYGSYDIDHPQTVEEGGNVVQIDDVDFDGFEVSATGTITLGEEATRQILSTADINDSVLVGLPYYAVAETIPLEFSDTNGNSTIGRKKTVTHAYLRYGDTRGLTYKTIGKEWSCRIAQKDVANDAEFLERGQVKLDTDSEYKWDSTIKILQRQPYPARIESITIGLRFNDPN